VTVFDRPGRKCYVFISFWLHQDIC
jgi:hypothetical protein